MTVSAAALLAGAAVPVSGAGAAQQGADAGQAGDTDDFVFEEIVVTAGRRKQSLQDVPAAVTAVDPGDFVLKGLKDVSGILDYTPGVAYNDTGVVGRGSISARGVSQNEDTPVFGVYLDDTPVSTSTAFSRGGSVLFDAMLMDVERVEIIKGPQGTLYGATSVGGMMRYISRDPALQEMRGSVGADVSTIKGGDWSQTYNGRISTPLIKDKLGITVSGFYRDMGGYVDYLDVEENVNDAEVYGYAADMIFVPTEALEIRLKYMKQSLDYPATSTIQLADADTDEGLFGDYVTGDAPGDNKLDYEIATGTINYGLGWGEFSSTSSYVKYEVGGLVDFTSAYGPIIDLLGGRDAGTTTRVDFVNSAGSEKFVQEVRLTSERMGAFEWIAGLYYATEDTFNFQRLDVTPAVNVLDARFPSKYEEFAGFGDITYYVTDNFDVTGGVRVSRHAVDLEFETTGFLIGDGLETYPQSKETVDTYLFSARYRPVDDMSFYARVASGYRPRTSTLSVIDPNTGENVAPPFMESDHVWSYELGVKGVAADNVVSYDLAFWKIDWSNFQTTLTINGVSTSGNAADGVSAHGFEGTFVLRPTNRLTLDTNFAYSKSTLNADELLIGGAEGDRVPRVPKWTWSVQGDYQFDITGDWFGNLGGGLRYVGSSVSAFSNPQGNLLLPELTSVDSRLLADANLSVTRGNLSIGLYATNLFNKRALIARRDDGVLVGANRTGVFTQPRTIGMNVKLDF